MSGPRVFRIAAAQYDVRRPDSFDAWAARITDWVEEAVEDGAELLVFPEYGLMELAGLLHGADVSVGEACAAVDGRRGDAEAVFAGLASRHGVHIVAPSGPVRTSAEGYRNRAVLFGPGGCLGFQDKLRLTPYERSLEFLEPGAALNVFDTPLGRLGITICYDSQFPAIARAMAEAGAQLLLAPSCTDALTGYNRVRAGCRARALENQCCTVQSSLLGLAGWLPMIDVNRGAAGVFGPPDVGFPEDGIIVSGDLDAPGWVYADIDRDRIEEVRANGQVGNFQDGFGLTLPEASLIDAR
jgi:predicted amidohydrolase